MKEIKVQTHQRTDFVDVTAEVAQVVNDLGCVDGIVTVFNPHTTAAVTINEGADPDVVRDMSVTLDKMVPWNDGYHHAEGNSAAHIKASMYGSSVQVILRAGKLQLGTWQKIWFCDFDGPRSRRLWVSI
ncbi:MAG: YjbQ family protein [bacterium]|nr:YjbQ family protein [bacterium]